MNRKPVNLEKLFIFLLAGYALMHLCLRLLISNSLAKDEAELVLYIQEGFKLGYNSQPPLYIWLQLLFFKIFGLSVFSLALLKNSLIFCLYFFLFRLSKVVLNQTLSAIFSTVSLFMVYNFSWIMHKDLATSIVLMAVCSATLFIFFKLIAHPKPFSYLLFGVCIGLGVLSKYNYLVFIVVLLLPGICIKDYRRVLVHKKIILTALPVFLILAPHVFWCSNNRGLVTSDVVDFNIQTANHFASSLTGLAELLRESFLFVLPLVVFYALFFPQGFKRSQNLPSAQAKAKRFLELFFAFAAAMVIALIFIYGVGRIKVRWMQPLLFVGPLYFFLRQKADFLAGRKEKIFIGLIIFCVVGTAGSVYGRIVFASPRAKFVPQNRPYDLLCGLVQEAGFSRGVIVAEDVVMAGNFKIYFPDSYVLAFDTPLFFNPPRNPDAVLIVRTYSQLEFPPDKMLRTLEQLNPQAYNSKPLVKQALYKYSKHDFYALDVAIVKK